MATARKATKPTPVRPLYPSLPIGIYRDGKLVKTTYLDDPRNAFTLAMEQLGVGLTAAPIKKGGAL